MNTFLNNKVVVITGASSGIGKAIADIALAEQAKVAVCARNIDKLKETFRQANPEKLLAFQADVSIEKDCESFIQETVDKFGKIDILINNAGISMRAMFEDLDLSVLKNLMDINFWGTVYCCKYAMPFIKDAKGTIVGISSIAGYRGLPARTGYSASKFAMQGFLESLRTELLHQDVNVLWAAPGFTASNIRNTALSADGKIQKETPLKESQLMSSEKCAELIMEGVKKKKRTIIMTVQGKLTVLLNKLFPKITDQIVFNHFAKEPGSPLKRKNK